MVTVRRKHWLNWLQMPARGLDTSHDERGFWAGLAAIRLLLALIVLSNHGAWFTSPAPYLSKFSGPAAVLGFLVISGYSIAHSITKSPNNFLHRRAIRILPTYFAGFILALAATSLCLEYGSVPDVKIEPLDFSAIMQSVFLLQFATGKTIMANAPLWSLSLEVTFYLLAPFFHSLSTKLLTALIALSATMFILWGRFNGPYFHQIGGGLNIALLVWAWLAGFIGYRFRKNIAMPLVLASLFVITIRFGKSEFYSGYWYVTIVVACLFLGPKMRLHKGVTRAAEFCGRISYPIYATHLPIFLILQLLNFEFWKMTVIVIAVASGISEFAEPSIKKAVAASVNSN